jgi:flagellar protein FliO/FliZ
MLDSLFGGQLGTMAKFAIAFVLVLGLIGITALILKRFGGGMPTSGGGRNRQPRLSVLDSAVVDSKRKLVLIRRDNSEHLLLIGGPTDVVVETNINRAGPVTSAGRSRAIPQQDLDALENALLAEPAYDEPAPQPAPRTPQPAPRPREAAPRPQLRPQPQPEPIDDLPLAPPLRPEPQPEPAAFSPPPPLPPRPVAHPSAAAPAPRSEADYSDMQAKMEAALRKPATAPAPRSPEPRAAQPAPPPRPAPPMPQTRVMPAAPAPAISQPVAPKSSAQGAPNPFDSLEAEMASLLGQDKKR